MKNKTSHPNFLFYFIFQLCLDLINYVGIFSGPKNQVFVKTISGKTASVEARGDTTIKEFKTLISDKIDMPPEYQSLIFGSKPLLDNNTLSDYSIGSNSTVHMTMRMRGGI